MKDGNEESIREKAGGGGEGWRALEGRLVAAFVRAKKPPAA